MILEETIINAIKFFGPLNKRDLMQKLELRGLQIELRDLDDALRVLNKQVQLDKSTMLIKLKR